MSESEQKDPSPPCPGPSTEKTRDEEKEREAINKIADEVKNVFPAKLTAIFDEVKEIVERHAGISLEDEGERTDYFRERYHRLLADLFTSAGISCMGGPRARTSEVVHRVATIHEDLIMMEQQRAQEKILEILAGPQIEAQAKLHSPDN